ncbi:hypothetical protein OROMI_033299 [Orobanche minor]
MCGPPPPHAPMNNTTDGQNHRQGTTQIHEEEEVDVDDDDDVPCSKSIQNPPFQIKYDPPNNSPSPSPLPVVEAPVEATEFYEMYPHVAPAVEDGGGYQLTLSFRDQVYTFDSIPPEKFQAVILLLGGYEEPTGIPTPGPDMTPRDHYLHQNSLEDDAIVMFNDVHVDIYNIDHISGGMVMVHEPCTGTNLRIAVVSGTPDHTQAAQSLLQAFKLAGS